MSGSEHVLTLGETGTKETGDLLDESLGGKESVVLLGELLDELLVLVEPARGRVAALAGLCWAGEGGRGVGCGDRYGYGHVLLQVVNRLVLKVNLLGAVDVGGIRENADGHARAGDVREPVRDSRVSTAVGRGGQTRREGRT